MPVLKSQFGALKSTENTWAIWDDRFPEKGCPCDDPQSLAERFFLPKLDRLKNDVIFLGLNPSNKVTWPLTNLHFPKSIYGKTNDGRIKTSIQERRLTRLIGAFMTDIYPMKIGKKSDEVISNLTPDDQSRAKEAFSSKLKLLTDQGNQVKVICFGDASFSEFGEIFGPERIRKNQPLLTSDSDKIENAVFEIEKRHIQLFKVYHYANQRLAIRYLVLKRQLEHLNGRFE